MSTTLSYGFTIPADGERGGTFFPILEDNIQKTNDHTHNGVNSSLLSIQAVAVTTQAIASGSWAATSGGTYKQTVTLPGTLTFDAISMEFRLAVLKHVIYPSVERVSATTYDIYINDNTLALTAIYST